MKNFYYEGQRFKNGNCHLRFSPDEIQDIRSGKFSDIEMLSFKMETMDLYFFGEQYCISNYEMGMDLYSAYCGKLYSLNYSDIDKILMSGRTLILHARKPDNDEQETIEKGDF